MDERSTKIAELLMKKPRPTTRSSGSPTAPMTTGHPGIRTDLSRSELPELLGNQGGPQRIDLPVGAASEHAEAERWRMVEPAQDRWPEQAD
jgi:hypothetical protein